MQREQATSELAERLPGRVDRSDEARFRASLDNLRLSILPDAVVQPRDEDDIAEVLRLANHHRVPIVPRGSGSATTGATTPLHGGWVLDLSAWKEIAIDATAGIAQVQPGAVVGDIQKAAEADGWFYPPDPSSAAYATIGGTIATNAGGLRGAKYGVTRDYVLGLEGFLPTGEKVRWAAPLKKYAAGFNLRDLWIGSEGMLGIITQASLKLIPRPAERQTLLLAFPDEDTALDGVSEILGRGILPAVLEFLDRQTVACVEAKWDRPVVHDQPGAALLLIECDGHPSAVRDEVAALKTWARESGTFFQLARDASQAEQLWKVRRSCSQAMFQFGPDKLNEDVVVPIAGYKPLLQFVRDLREEIGLATPTFGHAADGNFHVHIMYDRADPASARAAETGIERLFDRVVELGGAITGEHGIGLAKSPFLEKQLGAAEISAMERIREALDPNGICNPGKVFTPFPVWDHPKTEVRLPWDH